MSALASRMQTQAQASKEAKKQARAAVKAAVKKMSSKNDPMLAGLSRELRDRWLDAVQRDEGLLSLPPQDGTAYDVSRQLAAEPQRGGIKHVENVRRLAA